MQTTYRTPGITCEHCRMAIGREVSGVAGVTGETASSMTSARENARELSAMSLELERLVIGFRY